MKDRRFYEECEFHMVVVLDTTREMRATPMLSPARDPPTVWCRYGWSAPLVRDLTLVTYHAIPVEYLRTRCRRIPEQTARTLHPEVFAALP